MKDKQKDFMTGYNAYKNGRPLSDREIKNESIRHGWEFAEDEKHSRTIHTGNHFN